MKLISRTPAPPVIDPMTLQGSRADSHESAEIKDHHCQEHGARYWAAVAMTQRLFWEGCWCPCGNFQSILCHIASRFCKHLAKKDGGGLPFLISLFFPLVPAWLCFSIPLAGR